MPQPPASSHIYVQSRKVYYTFIGAKNQGFCVFFLKIPFGEILQTFILIFVQVADIAKFKPFDYNIYGKASLFDCV